MLSLSRRVAFALAGVGVTAVAGLAFARRALVDPDHEASLRQRLFVAFGDSRLAGIRLVGQEREAQASQRSDSKTGLVEENAALAPSFVRRRNDRPPRGVP